jgi:hypothetical protein
MGMAVTSGKDFAFSPQLLVSLRGLGPTRGCAVVTRRALYIVPFVSISGGGTTIKRTTLTIGGKPPAQYVAGLLADPQMTPEQLDAELGRQCGEIEGAITFAMDGVKRIKIRAGWFGRAVRFSARADGLWGNPFTENFGWRPAKPDVSAFSALFAGDPRLV